MSVPMLRRNGAPTIASAETDTLVRRYTAKVEPDPTNFRRGLIAYEDAPTLAERSTLEARHAELVRSLDRDDTQVRAHVTMMRNAFRSYVESREEADLNLLTWMFAVEGQPPWAVKEAARRFIQARVTAADDRRGPTPAEFCRVVNSITASVQTEIRDLETVLLAKVEPPIDPKKVAEVREKMSALIQGIIHRPVDPDHGAAERAEAEANLERLRERGQDGFTLGRAAA